MWFTRRLGRALECVRDLREGARELRLCARVCLGDHHEDGNRQGNRRGELVAACPTHKQKDPPQKKSQPQEFPLRSEPDCTPSPHGVFLLPQHECVWRHRVVWLHH